MITMSDDNVMMKQIVETHAPDGREVDVKPLLHLVEDILKRATLQTDTSLTVYPRKPVHTLLVLTKYKV